MSENTNENKHLPPYMSFKTLNSFVDRLNSSTTPPVIDKSVLSNMSGSGRSALMSALRYLQLVDGEDVVQDSLRNLVKAYKTDTWKAVLYDTLKGPYNEIVKDLDLKTGTDAQLQKAFKINGGVEGHMQINAIRFYLSFLKEAGIPYSPHFGMRRATPKSATRKIKPHRTSGKMKPPPLNDDGALSGLPAPIIGLLKTLPAINTGWTKDRRELFLTTFGAVMDFCYPIVEAEQPLQIDEDDSDKEDGAETL